MEINTFHIFIYFSNNPRLPIVEIVTRRVISNFGESPFKNKNLKNGVSFLILKNTIEFVVLHSTAEILICNVFLEKNLDKNCDNFGYSTLQGEPVNTRNQIIFYIRSILLIILTLFKF